MSPKPEVKAETLVRAAIIERFAKVPGGPSNGVFSTFKRCDPGRVDHGEPQDDHQRGAEARKGLVP